MLGHYLSPCPPRDKIDNHVRQIKRGAMNRHEAAQRRLLTARAQKDRMVMVQSKREKLQQDKIEHKIHLRRKWEKTTEDEDVRSTKATLQKRGRQTAALTVCTAASRFGVLHKILHEARLYDNMLYRSANMIQRNFRTFQAWKLMARTRRLRAFEHSIRNFVFRIQFLARSNRRKKVSPLCVGSDFSYLVDGRLLRNYFSLLKKRNRRIFFGLYFR